MSDSVPAIAYGFVGLTALVLTYATLADNGGKGNEPTESMTSMLPSMGEPAAESPSPEPVVAEAVPENKPEGSYGGKRRKHKGGKKSKMNKDKQTEKNKKNTRHRKI